MNVAEARPLLLLTRRDSGVGVLLLDCPGKLNSLGSQVITELKAALKAVSADPKIKALVMMSGKPDTFIIGADLFEIRKLTSEDELYALASSGQDALNMVANLNKPAVVAINGTCLGGGLELALAAHWRIAGSDPITQLGLPETKLGLIPGLGGTQRLPRIVGLKQSLSLILSAEPVGAEQALEIGLVDEVVPSAQLMEAAERRALALLEDPIFEKRRQLVGTGGGADCWPVSDVDSEKAQKLFAMTERSVRIKTRGHYPAQASVVPVMKTGLTQGIEAGLALEARTFARLAGSEVSANLIGLFFQTDFAKQSGAALAAKFCQEPTAVIGIVGGGVMGSSIAELAGGCGFRALLKTRPGKAEKTCDHIKAQSVECIEEYEKLKDAQLVIECVTEDLPEKQRVLKELEEKVSPEATIASNTSSLPLGELNSALQASDRFVGLHFFHPVDKMPLVEIVSLKSTSRKAVARAADFVTKLGKIPVMVKDGPGFLVDRLLACYLLEAAWLVESHVPLNWVEESAVDFGMPMGPFELLDEVGLDLAFKVVDSLYKELGDRMKPCSILQNIPKLGLVGKKTGVGVFLYDENGRRKEINPDVAAIPEIVISPDKPAESDRASIIDHLILPMVDEAARCLTDRIVAKPRELDMAIVYGIGFPPFRGGLLRYADHIGLPCVVERLQAVYAQGNSPRCVADLILKYVQEGRGFYSRGGGKEEE